MTDAHTMKSAVASVIEAQLSKIAPIERGTSNAQPDARFNEIREAILKTEQELRALIQGSEEEVHEWLAAIHYALADERSRLLGN